MTKPIIIANWKMNPSSSKESFELAEAIRKGVESMSAQVVLCPPHVFIPQLLAGKNVKIGAQNCSWQDKGALTGEVSPAQLKSIGCSFVILGHSERKKYLRETLAMIHKKTQAAIKAGLKVILCVESAAELGAAKKNILDFKNIMVVFEPRFAISTQGGKRVGPKDIATMITKLQKVAGKSTPILYGGSVDSKSIGDIMAQGKVQGALVGAASLNPSEFIALVKNASLS